MKFVPRKAVFFLFLENPAKNFIILKQEYNFAQMSQKFGGKYRIQSARAQWWDYANNGMYFVTICTQHRKHFFGDIVETPNYDRGAMHRASIVQMELNKIGEIVVREWKRTFDMRPDMNLCMDAFVVMPNHFHAIIGIGENKYNTNVEARCIAPLQSSPSPKNKFGPQSKNLASIIRGFKSAVTIHARKINPQFAWQSRFHDHIVRNEKSLKNIRRYIFNNPAIWHRDRNNAT